MRGDLAARTLTAIHETAECPSLSPDGTKVAYKKNISTGATPYWSIAVLDLASGIETVLPEKRNVDDQVEWLDDATLLYGLPRIRGRGRQQHLVDRGRRRERPEAVPRARLVALGGEVMAVSHAQVTIAGTAVDLLTFSDAVNLLCARAANRADRPLAVASINLDHIHHFGLGSRWPGALDSAQTTVEWLNLLDGAPVVAAARRATGDQWPRLAGSDLIGPFLERAAAEGLSVGFLGGTEETHERLRGSLVLKYPGPEGCRILGPVAHRIERSEPVGHDRTVGGTRRSGHPHREPGQAAAGAVDRRVRAPHRRPGDPRVRRGRGLSRRADPPRTGFRRTRRHGVGVASGVRAAPALPSLSRAGTGRVPQVRWPNAAARVTRVRSGLPAASDSSALPAAPVDARAGTVPRQQAATLLGSVIIPAHDEASVIARVLRPLAGLAAAHRLQVVVVCNGCRDDTAVIARRFPGVDVIEAREASKAAALNEGDAVATAWPRLYLDADIELTAATVLAVLESLGDGAALAARPASVYDTAGAGAIVRSYYRARSRVPSLHRGLWGAGAYALSHSGHERLGTFPDVTGDDFWVDQLFAPSEKVVVDTEPVIVHTPRDLPALIGILRRGHRGVTQAAGADPRVATSTVQTLRGVALSVRGPRQLSDAAVYTALSVAARLGTMRQSRPVAWERDDSSR